MNITQPIDQKKACVTLWLLLYSLSTAAATANELVDLMKLQQQNKKLFGAIRDYCKSQTKTILSLSESKMSRQLDAVQDLYIPTGALMSIFTELAMLNPDKIDAAFEEFETLLKKYKQ